MRRTAGALVVLALGVMLAACGGRKDANMCDFYQGLGVNYTHSQGFVPTSVRDEINKFC